MGEPTGGDRVPAEAARAAQACADLSGANLYGARLESAALAGRDLRGALLQGAMMRDADLRNADMREVQIGTLEVHSEDGSVSTRQPTDLRGADLRGALFTGAHIEPEPDLSHALFDRPLLLDEQCARDDAVWQRVRDRRGLVDADRPSFADCEAIYRQLKLNYQESGEYTTAGDFFVREMECKREQLRLTHRYAWAKMTLFHGLSGYGERPLWVARWIALIVIVCAWLQAVLGLNDGEGHVVGPGVDWVPSLAGFERFLIGLYFSMVTFTSLGYGDLRPEPGLGRLLAGVEAGLGLALVALLMVCIVRKFSR